MQIVRPVKLVVIFGLLALASAILVNCATEKAVSYSEADKTQTTKTSPSNVPQHSQKSTWEEIEIGKSINNAPIKATIYGSGKKAILVLAGIHGNEPSSVVLAKALDLSLQRAEITSDLKIILVPRANPDGLQANSRLNARNVDLNRNFPSTSWQAEATKDRYQPGKSPASEPETQAILSLMNTYKPLLIVSIHAPFACVNWDGPADKIASIIADASGYPLKKDIGYQTPGSLGTFAGIDRKIPTITLELRADEKQEQIEKNVKALQKAFLSVASR